MKIDIVTIFPEYFAPLDISLLGKARRTGLLDVRVHDLRDWTHDRHRTVDDTPYGGGPGMVMKPTPWGEALDTLVPPHPDSPGSPTPPPPPSPGHGTSATPTEVSPPKTPPHPPTTPTTAAPSEAETSPKTTPFGAPAQPDGTNSSGGATASGVPASSGGATSPDTGPSADTAPPPEAAPFGDHAAADRVEASGGVGAEGGTGSFGGTASYGGAAAAGAEAPSAAGAGMVPRLIIPTPSGRPFTQADAVRYAAEPWLIFACGRYEGIDSRVVEEARTRMPVDEVSLGDFVLAGGEVAVLVMIEAIGRLVPGVLGNAASVADDSFAPGAMESLLEGPVYTKPPVWRDRPVPDVLLSGHHGAIARWRRDEALRRTARHRPELLARLAPDDLDKQDRAILRDAGFPVDGEDMAD